ncbi:hypothetical protein QYE76_003620 [Lolium multiflorum]|uniref:Plastid transcriptionally active 6 n=1 Tax=Lolium multiflorum TaxID=4521 RepID=A0AAD8RQS8_LOLMU|nr:hypothetical protein QYE76_003620 [Lolium multiflorum]
MATTPLATASPYPFPFLSSKTLNPTTTSKLNPPHALSLSLLTTPAPLLLPSGRGRRQRDVSAAYGDGDMDDDFGDAGDFDLDGDDGVGDDEDLDNEQDYDVDYDRLLAPVKPRPQLSSAFDTVVDYTVDEDEFHKISLLHCDFFIRKVPDPDHDVYDFREMYVTPPDTDIYSIPRVLAPMPQKYVRCAKKNFGRYHVSEPPVEHMRDPLYKTEREIMMFS